MPIDNQFDPLRNVIGRLYDAIHGPGYHDSVGQGHGHVRPFDDLNMHDSPSAWNIPFNPMLGGRFDMRGGDRPIDRRGF